MKLRSDRGIRSVDSVHPWLGRLHPIYDDFRIDEIVFHMLLASRSALFSLIRISHTTIRAAYKVARCRNFNSTDHFSELSWKVYLTKYYMM